MIRRCASLAAFLACALAAPVGAGEAQDQLFARGVLDGVETGERLVYAFEREGAAAAAAGGQIELALAAGADGREAVLRFEAAAGGGRFEPFSASGGNPVFLAFLEQTVRAMAEATGGSPFYIRNRIRDAFARDVVGESVEAMVAGRAVPATTFAFRPFADDPNRARMGAFAELELRFTLSEAVPGRFIALEAVAQPRDGQPALRQSVTFDRLEEGE